MLLSGGGDPVIKLWNWMSGDLLADIPIEEAVNPFIIVKPPKGRYGRTDDDGEEEQPKFEKQGRRRGRGRGKRAQKDDSGTVEVTIADVEGEGLSVQAVEDETLETEAHTTHSKESSTANDEHAEHEAERLVLAVQRIDSIDVSGQGRFFLFSAVG